MPPVCDYCQQLSELVDGTRVYPHRPDLATKRFYACFACDAYVGCHPGTTEAMGRLANAELRRAKMRAHAAFDVLWKSRGMSRSRAYQWLATSLKLHPDKCHIGMLDVDTCVKVVDLVKAQHG